MQDKLEIKRSNHIPKLSWPTWVNLVGVALAAALVLVFLVYTVHQAESTLQANVDSKLTTILELECEAVNQWVSSEKQLASFLASDIEITKLLLKADFESGATQEFLKRELADIASKLESQSCLLVTKDMKVVSGFGDEWLARQVSDLESQLGEAMRSGELIFSKVIQPVDGRFDDEMFAFVIAAPIKNPSRGVVGCFVFSYDAGTELTQVLGSSRTGDTGETIALTETGKLISDSRFEDRSRKQTHFRGIAEGTIRLPETVVEFDFNRIQNQRGVETVSVSRWMPSIGIGLVTSMDRSEAFAPVVQIRQFMWMLSGLLALTTISAAVYRWHIYRLRKLAKQTELSRKRLGAYELEEKLGEGGMGVVYRAKHALMRRPTAIKILPPEKSNQASIERFEREVQYTSQLKHPNTISIYDYGRTEIGLFYYAMELLEGLNLEQLVRREGPLTDGRSILILRQVCESLQEAHSMGLIHRDIKPANIMLCDRGGAFDTVKVLDFGMVRDRSRGTRGSSNTLSGTPAYMAPECFVDPVGVDARVDVFAVGAVGFFLLCGTPLMEASNLRELMHTHETDLSTTARERIEAVAERLDRPISSILVDLISRCVATDPDKRPGSASEALEELIQCLPCFPWDCQSARDWWKASAGLEDAQETHADSPGPSRSLSAETQSPSISHETSEWSPRHID